MSIFIKSNTPTVEAEKTQDGAYRAKIHFPTPPARIGILAADMGVVSAGLVFLGIILLVANLPIGVWMLIIGFIIGMLLQGPNRRRHG